MEKQLLGVQNPCSQMWRMKSKSPTRSGQASIWGFRRCQWNEAGVQSLRVEDFIYCLHNCKIFTKLDLWQGYHQLALDSSTRQVAIFSAPWGNYRPRRLIFGAKSSKNVFDEALIQNLWSKAKLVEWWEHSPSTNVARIRFRAPKSYVGWVCWFSALWMFSPSTSVFPSHQKATFDLI